MILTAWEYIRNIIPVPHLTQIYGIWNPGVAQPFCFNKPSSHNFFFIVPILQVKKLKKIELISDRSRC